MSVSDNLKSQIIQIHRQEGAPLASKLFIFENTPPAKLKNATNNYAPSLSNDETIVFLYDDTLGGSANDGFLLTNKQLYFKNYLEQSFLLDISSIDNFTIKHGLLSSKMFVNKLDSSVLSITITESNKNEKNGMLNVLNKSIELLKRAKPSSEIAGNQTAARSANCRNCGAYILGNANNCEYCGSAIQ